MARSGRELLLATLRCEPVERVPWVPYVGCHGGSLVGRSARDYLRDADAIAAGVAAAAERYRADGLPVVFDLQIEAEALGCQLEWSTENPPAVRTHPLSEGVDLDDLPLPEPEVARYPIVLEAIQESRRKVGDQVALFGLVTGPFTLALHLMGHDIFMQMFLDEAKVMAVLDFCRQVAEVTANWYVEAGCDVIACVDPMTSQISPDHFEQFVSEPCGRFFGDLAEQNVPTCFFVCGDAQKNVTHMCETGPSAVFVDENIDLRYVAGIARDTFGIAFGGNIPLTTVMLHGTPDDNRRAARQCLDLGGTPGYVLAPGCDIPYAVPHENIAAIAEVVHGDHSGVVAERLAAKLDIELPDYERADLVRIDVFTLDSAACAPCQYMCEAVKAAMPEFEGKVEWVEHKLKTPSTVAMMGALGVTAIPSIFIDGRAAFNSLIPEERALKERIVQRLNEKGAA